MGYVIVTIIRYFLFVIFVSKELSYTNVLLFYNNYFVYFTCLLYQIFRVNVWSWFFKFKCISYQRGFCFDF